MDCRCAESTGGIERPFCAARFIHTLLVDSRSEYKDGIQT